VFYGHRPHRSAKGVWRGYLGGAGMILREERIGGQRLLLGDCRQIIGGLQFDAICTDPPYGLGKRMQGGTWAAKPVFDGFQVWDLEADQTMADRIISANVPTIIWGGNYFAVPASRCWLIWNKVNAVPTMADFEAAWTNLDRPSKRIDLNVGRVEYGHPTQKPLALMEWCLGFLPNGATVADFYMGSGTTLVACERLGRRGVGIEIDPGYFDIACRRVDEESRQPRMDLTPKTKPTQEAMEI